MISYKTKSAANATIINGIIIEGTICTVSLYIPRPPPIVRVPIFPIVVCVRSAYVIGAGVGFVVITAKHLNLTPKTT